MVGEKKINNRTIYSLIVITLSLLVLVSSGTSASNEPVCSQINFDGEGTAEQPYQISKLSHLQCIEEDLNANYIVSRNIDASDSEKWGEGFKPIEEFQGELRGKNHTIKHLYIERPEKGYTALFSRIGKNGEVKNLSIKESSVEGAWMTAIVAGENKGKISKVQTEGKVNGEGNVGGIVGSNKGSVNFSYSSAEVSGIDQTGGLIGRNHESGLLSYSYSNGSVQIENTGGGIIGYNNGVVRKVYSVSDIKSNSWNYSGTFIGMNNGNISSGYWLKDENPISYWYKSSKSNYQLINGSSLDQELMEGDACGMTGFNFSTYWDTNNNSFPKLQYSEKFENESRNCNYYVKNQDLNKLEGTGKYLLIAGIIIFFLIKRQI